MGQAIGCPGVSNVTTDHRERIRGVSNQRLYRGESMPIDSHECPKNSATKDDFRFIKGIGQGAYGKVYLVQHRTNKEHYAMKVVKKELVYRTYNDEGIKG